MAKRPLVDADGDGGVSPLGRWDKGALTGPERRLCAAAAVGRVLDLRSREAADDDPVGGRRWGPQRTIRAALLRRLLVGEASSADTAPRPIAVRVRGARIVGPLNLGGQTLTCPLELYECYLGDPVDLAKAEAPGISLRGSYLRRRLSARGLHVQHSLNLSRGFDCRGPVRLRDAHVGGVLDLTGGMFHNPTGDAIDADRVQVDGDLACRQGFVAEGAVWLRGAHVGGMLDLTGGRFHNPTGEAINADRAQVDGDLFGRRGFVAEGAVWLRGAHVGGVLDLTGARLRHPTGEAINAAGLGVDIAALWQPDEVRGTLNLGFARAAVWSDNATGRAAPTVLRGFRYDALRPGLDKVGPRERIAWLNRDPGYSPQPYRQLAALFRAEGHDDAARQVLVASENRRRRGRARRWPRRAWGRLLWITVGYGYQPWAALVWLVALIAVGTLTIMARPDAELMAGFSAPPRNALLYTVDTLLPFVDLGYSRWVANGFVLTVTTVLVGLGWVLATALVAAFAGTLNRGE